MSQCFTSENLQVGDFEESRNICLGLLKYDGTMAP